MQQCSMLLSHYQHSSWLTFSFATFSTYPCIPYVVLGVLRSCNITLTYNQSTERLQFINSVWDAMPVSHLHVAYVCSIISENFWWVWSNTAVDLYWIKSYRKLWMWALSRPAPLLYFALDPHTHKFITIRVAQLGRKCSSEWPIYIIGSFDHCHAPLGVSSFLFSVEICRKWLALF